MMPRRTKRQAKTQSSDGKKRPPTVATVIGVWESKPGANLSLLLSRVRAAQVRRTHFR
jgi:hypothetical protein